MLTAFQKRKLEKKFHVFDADGNGFLEKDDFDIIIANLAKLRGYPPGSGEYQQIQKMYGEFWDHLARFADANKDHKVTMEEWLEYHDAAFEMEAVMHTHGEGESMRPLAALVFQTIDADGDGKITRKEYHDFFRAFRIPESDADVSFDHLDMNRDGYVTEDEIFSAVTEFHFSDDPKATGNWLYGPI